MTSHSVPPFRPGQVGALGRADVDHLTETLDPAYTGERPPLERLATQAWCPGAMAPSIHYGSITQLLHDDRRQPYRRLVWRCTTPHRRADLAFDCADRALSAYQKHRARLEAGRLITVLADDDEEGAGRG